MALPYDQKSITTSELLDAQAHIWNHIFNFINSMSLKCAIQLGIPDIIHKNTKPITLSQLVTSLSINPKKSHSLFRLMRILTHSKFFVIVKISETSDQEGYWLTPASRFLLRHEPSSVAPFVLAMLEPTMMDPWHKISDWFKSDTNDPATFVMEHGRSFWEFAGSNPRLNDFFNEAMASDARLVSSAIIKDCKFVFEGLKSLVDVAGGTGTLAKAIACAYPEIKCIVLDLPHVVAGLEGSEILSYVGGDMFEYIPPADAVLLKWALECWSDEECVKILEKCKEAIPSKEKGGKVIIIDMVVGDHKEDDYKAHETQLFFDVFMMVYITGRERNEKEWEKLFVDAGFSSYKITPSLGLRSVIEVFP